MTAQFVDEEDKPYPRWNEIQNNEAIDCINEAHIMSQTADVENYAYLFSCQ